MSSNNDDGYFEAYENQMAQIESEQKEKDFVGPPEPFSDVLAKYNAQTASVQLKVKQLSSVYKHVRQVRGDGNCFYRCFTFGLLEHALGSSPDERKRIFKVVQDSKAKLVEQGFPDYCIEDFYDTLLGLFQLLLQVEQPQPTSNALLLQKIEHAMNELGTTDCCVSYMRFICSGHMRSNSSDFAPFLTSAPSVELFCRQKTEVFGCEAEDLHIVALCREFGVGVQVEYLDAHMPQHAVQFPQPHVLPVMHLLYRPGHFDLIYKSS